MVFHGMNSVFQQKKVFKKNKVIENFKLNSKLWKFIAEGGNKFWIEWGSTKDELF